MVNNFSKWGRKKLDEVMLDITNGTTQNQIDSPTAYPVTRIATISDGVIDPTRVKYLKEMNKKNLIKYRLKKGDILFSHINSIGHIGKTAYYDGTPKTLIHGMNLLKLRPNSDVILPKYLFAVINYELFRNRVKSLAKKAINQASINQQEVGSIYLDVPPLVEQRGIVEVLGAADACIRLTDAVIERAEELKQGLMQRLLTRGIGHIEYKETPLGEIPKKWKITKIGDVCEVGTGGTPSRKNPDYYNGDIPWVKSTEINYNIVYDTKEKISKKALRNSNTKYYPPGTLLVAMYGQGITRGKCAILGIYATVNQAIAAINNKNDELYIPFLKNWCEYHYRDIRNYGQGANQSNLNLRLIRQIKILLPPKMNRLK